jgi:putative protease
VRNNDFDAANLAAGIAQAHDRGRRFYLACNLMPHEAKVKTFLSDMEPVIAIGPDALIMADPGLIMLVRERWPDIPVHLSVQANTVNAQSVLFWQDLEGHPMDVALGAGYGVRIPVPLEECALGLVTRAL